MSRTRRHQDGEALDYSALDYEFPIGRKVCGVKLGKLSCVKEDEGYYKIRMSFVKNNVWITKFIDCKDRTYFESEDRYVKHKLHVQACLENLMSCYLSPQHMKNLIQNAGKIGIWHYVERIKEAIYDKGQWKIELCLKTVPGGGRRVYVSKYPPFVCNPDNTQWNLSYSRWEIEQFAKYKINLNE